MSLGGLAITPYLPRPVSTWMSVADDTLTIGEDAITLAEAAETYVDAYLQAENTWFMSLSITSMVSTDNWLRVASEITGEDYGEGDEIISGHGTGFPYHIGPCYLCFFSWTENPGAERVGTVTISDDWGNTHTITVTQDANTLPATANVGVLYGDIWLTLSGASASVTLGDVNITVSFTPDHGDKFVDELYTIYWSAFITRSDVYDNQACGTGSWGLIHDEVATTKTATITITPQSEDIIDIFLTVNYVDTENIYINTLAGITIEPIIHALYPDILITQCNITGSPMTFAWDDEYDIPLTDAQVVNIMAYPHHGATIIYIESWLRIYDGVGAEVVVGYRADDPVDPLLGEDLYIVPYSANDSGERTGTYDPVNHPGVAVVFQNVLGGDLGFVVVSQDEGVTIFDAIDTPDGGIFMDMSKDHIVLYGTPHAYCTDGTNDVNLIFQTNDPTKTDGSSYTMYYSVWVKFTGESAYEKQAYGSIPGCVNYNFGTTNVWLELSDVITTTDSVQVWLSNKAIVQFKDYEYLISDTIL